MATPIIAAPRGKRSTRTSKASGSASGEPSAGDACKEACNEAAFTLSTCMEVLGFLVEFHGRESPNEHEPEIDSAEMYILGHIQDLLGEQKRALQDAFDRRAEVSHG